MADDPVGDEMRARETESAGQLAKRLRRGRVRVIRVLEYDYVNQETAERDMARWMVPANGVRQHGRNVIRSACTFPETMPAQDGESDDRE